MKKLSALLLILCLVCSFAACGETPTITTGELGAPVGEIPAAPITTEATTTAPAPVKNYPDNILMADRERTSTACVLGNENVLRRDIATVTFLDTLGGKPADAWDVSDEKNGSVWAWVDSGMNLYIAGEGGVTAKDCVSLFQYYSNATSIDFGGCFYTDLSHQLSMMFVYCKKLETADLSGWNVSQADSFSELFYQCHSLRSVSLDGWDTSGAYYMGGMFDGCKNLEQVDVSHFNTRNVLSFDSMFSGCKKLTNLAVGNWDVSSAKRMYNMFFGCSALTELDLSSWDTANVQSMSYMLAWCTSLTSIGDLKIPEGCETTDMFEGTPLA